MNESTVKRFAVLTAAAGLSTWAIDMAATQVGLPSMQAALGVSVTASQWILNLTLMILAGIVTVGGSLGTLAWISLAATLATLFVALKLPKPQASQQVPTSAKAGAG